MVPLTRDYYKLSKADRLLYLSGIPLNHIKRAVDPEKFNFQPVQCRIEDKSVFIDKKMQKDFFGILLQNINSFGQSSLYAIGSHPTDQSGYDMLAYISRFFMEKVSSKIIIPNLKWIDLGRPDWSYLNDDSKYHLIVLHGLSKESDQKRIEIAKDFLRSSSGTTCFIFAVDSNILEFCETRLNVTPDAICQLGKTTHRSVA